MIVIIEYPLEGIDRFHLHGDAVILVLYLSVDQIEHLSCRIGQRISDRVIAVPGIRIVNHNATVNDGNVGRLDHVAILFDRHRQLDALVLSGEQVVRMEVGTVGTEQDGYRAAGFREAHTLRTGLDGKQLGLAGFLNPVDNVSHTSEQVFFASLRLEATSRNVDATALAVYLVDALETRHGFHKLDTAVVAPVHINRKLGALDCRVLSLGRLAN